MYTDIFTASNVYPSELSYAAVTLTSDIVLSWPEETSESTNLAARIMDITPDTTGWSIILPDAAKSAPGNTILFNNRGAYTFTVKNADDVQVMTVASGTLWQIYLSDNTTSAGVWETLQYGSTTSIANASALAGVGIVATGTMLSQSVPITGFNSDYTAGASDRAKMFNWTSTGSGTLTLPQPATVGNNWFIYLRNSGGGAINAVASGTTLIDGVSYIAFQPGESAIIASDGTNCFTVGFGKSATYAFEFTVISVAGAGDYTLSGTELNSTAFRFNGVLTGNRTIIVPNTVQQYWVDNQTTGAFTFNVKTSAGTPLTIASSERAILYCDGTNVVKADTAGLPGTLPITLGGTGATSAGGALINLGGTSVGTAIFTAVDADSAWSTLGVAPSGVVNGGTF